MKLKCFVHRIEEIVGGRAPAASSILRYNQKAIPVLSYVSQFAPPPFSANVCALAHGAIHKIIRIPPNSMSRVLSHSMSFCSAVQPIPVLAYCGAHLIRFAQSERCHFLSLQSKVAGLVEMISLLLC